MIAMGDATTSYHTLVVACPCIAGVYVWRMVVAGRKFLTKGEILGSKDIEPVDFEVPEWGGWVRIMPLNGEQRDAFEASTFDRQGRKIKLKLENLRARLVAWSLVDDAGNRIFNDTDVLALGKKSARALDHVYDKCQELSGLTEEDVEELTGNSVSSPNGVTITA